MRRRSSERDAPENGKVTRRVNWSLLSIVCVAFGVLAAAAIGVFVFRAASAEPLEQVLHAVAQPIDLNSRVAAEAPRVQTATRSLLPYVEPAAVDATGLVGTQLLPVDAVPVGVPSDGVTAGGATSTAPLSTPQANATGASNSLAAPDSGDSAEAPSTSTSNAPLNSAPSPVAQATTLLDEPPPNAALGFTYCGMVTCNVGFSCCCGVCVAADEACEPSACEAHAGLSVSVACGMQLCDPGEVCCDPRCGACARAGECPEEPCG